MMWIAMAAGLQDGRAGLPLDKNPYAPGTEAASIWEAGWNIATNRIDGEAAKSSTGQIGLPAAQQGDGSSAP